MTLAVNTMIISIEFRGKTRDLGFEAKAMPRGTQSGILSYEVIDQRS